MRMDNAWSRDLAMSASANPHTGMAYALFHGCDEQDVKVLTDWFQITTPSAGHPFLLPALFIELQLRRHKRIAREKWTNLIKLYAHTGQYGDSNDGPPPVVTQAISSDYNTTTKEILGMYQDTGFLETVLLRLRNGLKRLIKQVEVNEGTILDAQAQTLSTESARIRTRLEEMMDEYEGLIAECKLVTEGASLLTNAVSAILFPVQALLEPFLTIKLGMESHSTERCRGHPIDSQRFT